MSKAFGTHLRTLRKTNSTYTQQNMADMLKISRSTYTYYETGKSEPGQEALGKICKILSVDYNTLLGYSENGGLNVAEGGKTFGSLTPDEEQFLTAYRSMNSEEKASLRKYVLKIICK